jgi:hypothetical protein
MAKSSHAASSLCRVAAAGARHVRRLVRWHVYGIPVIEGEG